MTAFRAVRPSRGLATIPRSYALKNSLGVHHDRYIARPLVPAEERLSQVALVVRDHCLICKQLTLVYSAYRPPAGKPTGTQAKT
jgi:hypothetical protein